MRDAASESPDRSKLSTAATTASDFLAFEISRCQRSITSLCTESIRKLREFPTVANALAPVVPLVTSTAANSLEVKPEVPASKIPRMSLLISEFEEFNAWPTFVHCSVIRRVQCLMASPLFRRREPSLKRAESEEIQHQTNTFLS